MTRSRRILALGLIALTSACTEHSIGPDSPGARGITLRPQYAVAAGANIEFRPINAIRLIVRDASTNAVVDSITVPVDPSQSEWPLALEVAPTEANQRVVVTAELIHHSGSGQIVELSGATDVFELSTEVPVVREIHVYPGPLTNLQVTGLSITDVPSGLPEGGVAQLRAEATLPAGISARVFWGTSDATILDVDSAGGLRALQPGTARITAQAGQAIAVADITVAARPSTIELAPTSIALNFIGAEATIAARVLDARGALLPGREVSWTVADSQIVQHLGAGRFRAAGTGSTSIQAMIAGVPAISASATATVAQTVSTVRVTPVAAALLSRGHTVQLEAAVEDAGGAVIPGAVVSWSSSNPSAATVDANGLVTAVDDGLTVITASSGEASATADVRVARAPHTIAIVQGNAQSADAGATLDTSPAVQVSDASGTPVVGANVHFAVSAGGGSIEHAVVPTDANGFAEAGHWTLGGTAGTNTLTATVNGLEPVTFTATANAVVTGPGSIAIVSGDNQAAHVGQTLEGTIAVKVLDALGHPRSTEVVFAVASGGGSVIGGCVIGGTEHTDTTGVARFHGWVLGTTPGTNTLTATVDGLEPVIFTATALPGAPHTIAIIAGDGQTANAGSAVPDAPAVRVSDAFGNLLQDVAVTFTVTAGGGSVTGAVDSTDVEGVAEAGSWTLGTAPGLNTLTAEIAGLSPVTFTATAVSSTPIITLALAAGHSNVGVTFTAPLRVLLNVPAPAGGLAVTVVSSNTGKLTVAAPGSVTIPQGESEGIIQLAGIDAGSVMLSGTAAGYAQGDLTVTVSLRLISLPLSLNVPYGQTTSLPVQLAEPAPPGGVVVSLVSSDETIVGIPSPTVTIPAGAVLASATVRGLLPGPVTVTASAPGYIGATSSVVSRANLDIVESNVLINESFGDTLTLRLQSSGSPIASPAGGVLITLHAADPGCVAVAANATILEGLTQTIVPVSYGGNTTTVCNTRVHATATNILPDSVGVQVNPTPNITLNPVTVGTALQKATSVFLGATNHGGTTVTLTSASSSRLLLAPDAGTVGSDTLVLFIPDNQSSATYVVQSVGDTGTVVIHASAAGFYTGNTTHTIAPAAIQLFGIPGSMTTLSDDDLFHVRIGLTNSGQSGLIEFQSRRAGAPPLVVTIQSDSPSVGRLVTSSGDTTTTTVLIQPETNVSPSSIADGGVAVRPAGPGTTFIRATAADVISTSSAVQTVNISAPVISMSGSTTGAGLQRSQSVTLGANAHGGVTVRVTSADPSKLLVSSNSGTAGSAFIDVPLANGSNGFTFYTQALEGVADTVKVVVTAPAFVSDSAKVAIVTPAIDLSGLPGSMTTTSQADAFAARIGLSNGAATGLIELQSVRAGGTGYFVSITSSAPAVADLLTSNDTAASITVAITPGRSSTPGDLASGGVELRALTAGSVTVSASAPGAISTTSASRALTVSGASISLNSFAVGAGLQRAQSGSLSGSNHGGVTVRLTSTDTTKLLIAPDATTAGSEYIDIAIPDGTTSFSFYTQAMDGTTGTVSVTATATGFANANALISVVEPGFDISGLQTAMNTLTPADAFTVRVGLPSGSTSLIELQNRRFGAAPLVAMLTSSTTAGQIVTSSSAGGTGTTTIAPNTSSSPGTVAAGGVAFRPFTTGTTVVTANIPGFRVLSTSQVTVNVSAPSITLNSVTVGAGLQKVTSGSLSSANHGGVTVRITSSNSNIALISPHTATAGQPAIDLFVPNGISNFNFYVSGIEGATGTVAIRAAVPGFTDASTTAAVVQPAFEISGLSSSMTTASNPDIFQVRVGLPLANMTGLVELQHVRAGAPPLAVTLRNSDAGVARLVTSSESGTSTTLSITPGTFTTSGTLAGGGVQFEPLSAGSTTVTAVISGYNPTTAAVRTVTVTGTDQ